MAMYVKLDENNNVLQVWDTPPPAAESGWHDAIEVRPTLVPHRQGYTAHRFDIDKRPIEIIWDTYEIAVEDRKSGMVSQAKSMFQQADTPVVDSTRTTQLEAATTHDELDALL
jgi:hypothetical protein